MRAKVTIVGAGMTGGTMAQRLAETGYVDVVLHDIIEGLPQGKALDLGESAPHIGFDGRIMGTNDWNDTAGSNVVVITSGVPRKPGMTREELLNINAGIVRDVAKNAVKHSPDAVYIIFANPMDVMCHVALEATGVPRERVVGQGGMLDSARYRTFIAWETKASVNDVHAQVLGGHAEATMVPIVSTAHVGGVPLTSLLSSDRIDAVVTSDGVLTADNYVLALGVGSPIVARTAGVSLPIYPAKGYSSTFPLKPGGLAPTIPGVDEQGLVGWSRLGDRLRLTSTAEFAGYDWGWTPRDFNNILRFARDVFPNAVDYDRGEYRACLRPMTPDGPPILGLGRHRNLFFNCGHGHMGWTMACGTARIVADLMNGRMPELDLEGLTPRR